MRSWILSLSFAALLAVSAPFYALWAQTPPGDPRDPAEQPGVPAAAQPASDTAESPGAAENAPADTPATAREADAGPDARLAALLPPGSSREDACKGFKSGPECLAALHAAHNLGIPFADLKSRVTAGERLTSALTQLKPGTDAKAEVRKAAEQAQMDLRRPGG